MEFTYAIDDSIVKEVIQLIGNKLSYSATLPSGDPNPQSEIDFMVQAGVNYLLGLAVQQKVDEFTRTTMATASQSIAAQTAIIQSQLAIQGVVTKPPPVN